MTSISQVADLDISGWIRVPADFRKDIKENLAVSPSRIAYSPAVERVAQEIGVDLRDTSRDSLERDFVGDINHSQALRLTELLGTSAITLPEFTDLGRLLLQGSKKEIGVYTIGGRRLKSHEVRAFFDDIFTVKSPWRAELLRDKYEGVDEQINVCYGDAREVLKGSLMEDKTPGIDRGDWLKKSTKQGLPRSRIKKGDLFYWHPRDGSVPRFIAVSDWACLNCNRDPSDRGPYLGVRAAKQLK